jgi:hypothetical protein
MLAVVALLSGAQPAWASQPATPDFTLIPIDPYARQPVHNCLEADPKRFGVEGFAELVLASYPTIVRGDAWAPCNTHSPESRHHDGRARSWTTYTAGACPDPAESNTVCHRDHVHFGFSKAGSDGRTSWWQGLRGWAQSTLAELLP